MTTTTSKTTRTTAPAAKAAPAIPATPAAAPDGKARQPHGTAYAIGKLAVDAYERGIADLVALEKDAARLAPYPWAKSMLTLHAGLLEDVSAAYVKTARAALR
jgi:hypothetical protein